MKAIPLFLLIFIASCITACLSSEYERPVVGNGVKIGSPTIERVTLSWSRERLDATVYLRDSFSNRKLRDYPSTRVECSFYTDSTFSSTIGAAYTIVQDSNYLIRTDSLISLKVTIPFYSFGADFDHYQSFAVKDIRFLSY